MRIELNKGCPKFAASDANVHLDIYTPQATIDRITPIIKQGLDLGWIILKEDPKPMEETVAVDAMPESVPETEPEAPEAQDEAEPETVVEHKAKRPTQKKACAGTVKSGAKCKKNALVGSDFCITHISEGDLEKIDLELAGVEDSEETDDVRSD